MKTPRIVLVAACIIDGHAELIDYYLPMSAARITRSASRLSRADLQTLSKLVETLPRYVSKWGSPAGRKRRSQ